MIVEFTDNFLVKRELEEAVLRALERIGQQAEGYAKVLRPIDTVTRETAFLARHNLN